MRHPGVLGTAALAVAVAGLASCGTWPSTDANATRPARSAKTALVSADAGGPAAGTRAESVRLARRLLSLLVLPRGTRRLPSQPVPIGLSQSVAGGLAATTTIDRYRLYSLPLSVARASTFFATHVPAGMTTEGTGQSGEGGGVTALLVTDTPVRLPAGISAVDLTDTIVPGPPGRALLRADVQVIWFPARSAAEHLVAADFRAVRIDAWIYGTAVRHIRSTFTATPVIARLARLLNVLPASPGGLVNCPMIWATYQLTFKAAAGHPDAVFNADNCLTVPVSVGGAKEPDLYDGSSTVAAAAGHLLHVRVNSAG